MITGRLDYNLLLYCGRVEAELSGNQRLRRALEHPRTPIRCPVLQTFFTRYRYSVFSTQLEVLLNLTVLSYRLTV